MYIFPNKNNKTDLKKITKVKKNCKNALLEQWTLNAHDKLLLLIFVGLPLCFHIPTKKKKILVKV